MLTYPGELVTALRRTLGRHWDFDCEGDHLRIRHQAHDAFYRPRRRPTSWDEILDILAATFADHGIAQAPPLPLRWNRETDFTISAIQALDPYLKHRRPYTYRQGYLLQPVVRFTGQRSSSGCLADGFLTAFVNVSCVLPISEPAEHAQILDTWLTALSRLGLHARHVEIHGVITPWRRREVQGITLRIRHGGLEIGDIVLLRNADRPSFMATDLGSGLERLRWAITRKPWVSVVYGSLAERADPAVLDIVRAATSSPETESRPVIAGPAMPCDDWLGPSLPPMPHSG